MTCDHDLAERETACADGACPICLAEEIRVLKQMRWGGETKLWEVLVPVAGNDGVKYPRYHHEEWDAKVNEITGGLTIEPVRKGKWQGSAEHMIPVRIACTREQLERVIDATAEHYEQEAVMARLVSDEVVIKRFDR